MDASPMLNFRTCTETSVLVVRDAAAGMGVAAPTISVRRPRSGATFDVA
jgi:hypothetical protein